MEPIFNVRQQSEIYIGPTADILPGVLPGGRVVVVSDATIDRLYHPMLAPYDTVLIGLGESIKTLQTVESIYRRFIELGVDRSTFVLGIGGGIVTDVAGFAAATYMRGLDFGFVSTTLLGQVDASVGGKNGVNVDGYKNMAGTFSQPRFVICDPGMLRTLSDREFRAGLAEVVKAATNGWGANIVFEASGGAKAFEHIFELLCPGGCVVLVGIPVDKVPFDIVAIQAKEARIESVFRYANIFPRALALISSGKIDVKRFISRVFPFAQGVEAFEEAAKARPGDVKIQIAVTE